ncbi:MAG TPA: PilZ domain-containing protein [Symbiobacteriaceae bacterium]|nr:PilZ domain-containing protein [Symbiobacteriaceae bacterium]
MELPNINQKVELKLLGGPFAAAYSTYVEDAGRDGITVVHPTVGGKLLPLAPGDMVRLEYAVKGLARLCFTSRVSHVDGGSVPLVTVTLPEEARVERFQQRDFVRLDAELKLLYYVVGTPDNAARPGGVFRSHTRDISGNGLQILCPEPYPPGTQLDIHLEVGERVVHAVGEIIRQVAQLSPREYWMGVRFVGLDERDRDVIIRYIFGEQRDRRRRGLL